MSTTSPTVIAAPGVISGVTSHFNTPQSKLDVGSCARSMIGDGPVMVGCPFLVSRVRPGLKDPEGTPATTSQPFQGSHPSPLPRTMGRARGALAPGEGCCRRARFLLFPKPYLREPLRCFHDR